MLEQAKDQDLDDQSNVILRGAVENNFESSAGDSEGGPHGMGSSSSLRGRIKSEWEARDIKKRYEEGEDRLMI